MFSKERLLRIPGTLIGLYLFALGPCSIGVHGLVTGTFIEASKRGNTYSSFTGGAGLSLSLTYIFLSMLASYAATVFFIDGFKNDHQVTTSMIKKSLVVEVVVIALALVMHFQ